MKNGLRHLFRKNSVVYEMLRFYSQYPKSYEFPVYNLEKIKQQDESEENLAKAYVNFRAAKSSETSSVFYNPLLSYFTNHIMRKGNRQLALDIMSQVPAEITENRAKFLAVKWLIESGKDKDRKIRFYDKLAFELLSASENEGSAVKKKQELHRQCEANRAFAHYRWN